MADVIINDIYLSAIADAIRAKLGTASTYTPPNMASAIRSISGGGSSGSYQDKTVDPSTSQQIINPDTGYDALSSVTVNAMPSGTAGTPTATKGTVSNHSISITPSVNNTTGYIVGGKKTGTSVSVSASELVSGSQTITSNGTVDVTNLAEVVVNVDDAPVLQTITKSYIPTESAQSETIVPGTGYDGLLEVEVTVDAISSTYVGSEIARRSSSNLTASGATVTAPAGYYASSASKSVATGTAGTPTATKSAVSNHSISVTPSVTNSTGYITGGTKNGTAVSVSASELVSGTLSVTTNGTKDVTNYASINVNISGDVPVLQDKTVTPTELEQVIEPDNDYDALSSVTVNAIDSNYVGSGISRKDSTSLTVSGATITAPAGYYASNASKSVASMTLPTAATSSATSGYASKATIGRSTSNQYLNIPVGYNATASYYTISATPNGTAGTPSATKGTVSNNSISITPSVTNTTGYITGGTKTGTAVTVSASELVSGNKAITSNGTGIDVTNYATVSVSVGSDVNNQDKSVTPTESEQSVTADSGYSGLGTVTVGAISSTYVGSEIDRRDSTDLTGAYANSKYTVTAPSGYYSSNASYSIDSKGASDITTDISGSSFRVNWEQGFYGGGSKSVATVKTSSDLTVNGATVTAPAGYYSEAASKSVATMTLPTSTSASATSGYTSKAIVSRSTSDQYINIPTGYNSAGGYYKISATPNGSVTAPSSISGTTATVSTGTNTLTLTKTVSVTPNVTTAGYIATGTAGNSSVSLTASITVDPTPTASGKTVTTPAGYYSTSTTTDVATMTLPTSASASATSGYTSKATIGRSTSDQYINIPTGYNSSGAYYKISAVANGSATAPASISGTSATVSTGTNTLTLTKTVSVTPSVTAGYISSGTAGNSSVSLTASVTTKAAATITPGTTNQTIASGTYLTGTQTIAGDADLVAGNIKAGTNIFNVSGTFTSDATATASDIVDGETAYVNGSKVTGTLVLQTVYTGSSAPSSSTGVNGDIYIQE